MSESGGRSYDVFLSHAGYGAEKQGIASLISDQLEKFGLNVFLDRKSLEVGTAAAHSIVRAAATAEVIVVVLSPDYLGRKWTLRELEIALARYQGQSFHACLGKTWSREEMELLSGVMPKESIHVAPLFFRLSPADCNDIDTMIEKDSKLKDQFELWSNGQERYDRRCRSALAEVSKIVGLPYIEEAQDYTEYALKVTECIVEKWFPEKADTVSTSSDGSAGFVGIDTTVGPADLVENGSWQAKLQAAEYRIRTQLEQLLRFGEKDFGEPNVKVQQMVQGQTVRAVATLTCVISLRRSLENHEKRRIRIICSALKKILRDCGKECGVSDEALNDMLGVDTVFAGSLNVLLVASSPIFENLFKKLAKSKMRLELSKNKKDGLYLSGLFPAFSVTLKHTVRIRWNKTEPLPDVWLWRHSRLCLLCPASKSEIFREHVKFDELTDEESIERAWKSLPFVGIVPRQRAIAPTANKSSNERTSLHSGNSSISIGPVASASVSHVDVSEGKKGIQELWFIPLILGVMSEW